MKSGLSSLTFAATLSLALAAGNARSEAAGEDIKVHNNTGHEVAVFIFQEGGVHTDESGGTQFATLKNGESAVAHVPDCDFSVLLVDDEDIWHAEMHDCNSTDLTFNADTGHSTKPSAAASTANAQTHEETADHDDDADHHDDADHDDDDDGDDDADDDGVDDDSDDDDHSDEG